MGGSKSTADRSFQKKYAAFDYCEVPRVRQSSERSCGMAALASLLRYWNEDETVSERELTSRYPPESKTGYPLAQLKEVAVNEGLLAFAVTLDRDPMNQLLGHLQKGRPVLVGAEVPKGRYFGEGLPLVETLDRRVVSGLGDPLKHHYVVAMGASPRDMLLMDPQYGYVRITKSDFDQFWKGMNYAALITSAKPGGVETASR